jgi:Xaa-Pro dipeptidase
MTTVACNVPLEELMGRLGKLRQAMDKGGIDGALIVQKTDLFYFSGTSQQAWLYLPREGEPLLMVFKEYERARQESPLSEIISIVGVKNIPQVLADYGYPHPGVLGLELDVLPVNLYLQYLKIFTGARLVDLSTEIRLVRAVKSEFELAKMKAAAVCADLVAARAAEVVAAGKTEVALAGELEGYARSLGHQGIVRMRMWNNELFYGHLMAGAGAAVPSYLASPTGGVGVSGAIGQGAGMRAIGRREPILVDYVFALDGYLADHTRIFALGPIDSRLQEAHQAMLDIQEEIRAFAKPGVSSGEIYERMVARAGAMDCGDHFMGVGERRIRFTGHGIGLELDEFPFIAKGQTLPLSVGMIIALEPKAIFPGLGVVGIENTHVVTEQGLQPLTLYPDAITVLPENG